MKLFWETLTAVLFFLGVSGLIYYIRAACRLPLVRGEDITVRSTVIVVGQGDNLQPTVEALLWLHGDSGQPGEILLDVREAREEARKKARLLKKYYKEIDLLE